MPITFPLGFTIGSIKDSLTIAGAGGVDTWNIMDTTNLIAWRVSCIIGGSYNNNLITIERLV